MLWIFYQIRLSESKFVLSEDWQRTYCFERMNNVCRSHKSVVVKSTREERNRKARLRLKSNNVKLIQDWKTFLAKCKLIFLFFYF